LSFTAAIAALAVLKPLRAHFTAASPKLGSVSNDPLSARSE
jgi:hypothetical protein